MIKDILNANENITAATAAENKLKAALPQCFDKDGNFCLEKLQELLKKDVLADENYELNFLGKSYGRLLQAMETDTVITPDEEHNSLPQNANSENLYITGDNLDALKHLLKSYENKIKCIYIDPPYNTGSDGFVYNDRFSFTKETLMQKLSVNEEKAERILELTTRGSASHSAWLTFMYPRLLLARDLLTDDGVIFISIDDNEQANLKLLCDDVFGEQNFVAQLIWERAYSPKNDAKYISNSHEYLLMYAFNINKFIIGRLPRTEEANARYQNPDNDPRGVWKPSDMSVKTYNAECDYPITAPSGRVIEPPTGRCWSLSKKAFFERLRDNRIWFGADGNSVPCIKRFLSELKFEGLAPTSILFYKEVGHSQEGAKEVTKLLNAGVFDGPKTIRLLRRILTLANLDRSSIILDFFSGSATTAHAVMQLNAEDGSNRKFILVQLPEATKADSEARRAGYETIDQIGRERIKCAAAKIKEEHPDTTTDLGFKHFRLNQLNSTQLSQIETFSPELNLVGSDDLLQNFGTQTVLATWFNRDGYGLNPVIKAEKLADYTSYICGSHIYLLENGFDNKALMELCRKYEEDAAFATITNIVVFGYSFSYTELQALQDNVKKFSVTHNSRINVEIRY